MTVPYKMKFCLKCQESTEHFDDRQYSEDREQWNCIQCFDRTDSEDALDYAEELDEGMIYDEW